MREPTIGSRGLISVTVLLATVSCVSTLPPITPAPPPGTPEYAEAAGWEGVDGWVEVEMSERARNQAFVAARNYCQGPFEIVREKKRMTMTVLSFPIPYQVQRLFFKCGVEAPSKAEPDAPDAAEEAG